MPETQVQFPSGTTVLLVDDSPVDRLILQRLLEQHQASVVAVESGEEAFNECLRKGYDLVFLNANLPGMDGVNTAAWMRSVPHMAEVPIVILTADSSKLPLDVRQGGSYQMVLVKPFMTEGLIEMLVGLIRADHQIGEENESKTVHLAGAQIRQLRRFLGEEGLRESLEDYFIEAEALLLLMRSEVYKEDLKAIQETAHKLKGSSATVGARKIAIYAEKVSSLALEKSWTEIPPLIHTISECITYLKSNFEKDLRNES
jgi:CheY-like chemotaxis protein